MEASKCKLNESLKAFLQEASLAEQQAHEQSRNKVLKILKEVKASHDAKYPPSPPDSEQKLVDSVKSACRTVSETAYDYTQIMDVMVGQAPEYIALAYGAVRIILVTHTNYMEMKDNIETLMGRIKANFDLVDHLTSYHPSKVNCVPAFCTMSQLTLENKKLVNAIVEMYNYFHKFLAEALTFYTTSRWSTSSIYVGFGLLLIFAEHTFKSFKKPWKALEPIVDSIDDSFTSIKDFILLSTHYTGELNLRISQANFNTNRAVLERLINLENVIKIRFSTTEDVHETGGVFRQIVESKMEQHQIADDASADEQLSQDHLHGPHEPPSLDDHLASIFADLVSLDNAAAEQQMMTEQLPEMEPHRRMKRSIWRANTVMDWLETKTSRLLWVDGGYALPRQSFNASFVVPLLLFGDSTSETGCLVLRHFCGDAASIRPWNHRALIQALVQQLLKRRPDVWPSVRKDLTQDNARDIRKLWSIFVSCIKQVDADCTFIIIDSIDCLVSDDVDQDTDARRFVMEELNSLVKESKPMIKILLTASMSQKSWAGGEPLSSATDIISSNLIPLSTPVIRQPRRSLSLGIMENELAFLSQTLNDIQEKRRTAVSFMELPMLYPVNSTIYTRQNSDLQAFVVSEISGMDPRSVGTLTRYEPLLLRAWGIHHDGKSFVKKHYDFQIRQFSGQMEIEKLAYIPSGYLIDEHKHRHHLIRRGRRYWELGSGVHFLQYFENAVSVWRILQGNGYN